MRTLPLLTLLALAACADQARAAADDGRRWLAGDHHVHSEWSVDWDRSTTPPTPIRGGDSPYTRTRNAQQALAHGLSWMVHTDHGGPGHSAVTRDHAWPALLQARREVPSLIQFNGMEFDVPAAEHASLIIAPGPEERDQLIAIERDYSRNEPLQPGGRDDGQLMLDALAHMRTLPAPPLVFVNHPSRTASGVGQWGDVDPAELRAWHDAAPQILVGMEGAPGHQAAPAHRGLYRNQAAPTFGGFDQMTAQVGGVWDTLLAEGRRFWITATSDSHVNLRDGGRDFDPGQYSKTYVWARHEAEDILEGMRAGRMFAVTGDLIDALDLTVHASGTADRSAGMGETLAVPPGATLRVDVKVRQPTQPNFNGQRPALHHIDVIVGTGDGEAGPQMQVERFGPEQWKSEGQWRTVSWELPVPQHGAFVRARGSSTAETTPLADVPGEDPWQDLWFYSNPVFVEIAR
ncbi:hypothetical protein [Pseudoxanthomonas wuyuanensis]|uniref:Phosphoesterase n=1 Tax=Pseudoxanthomonas wuyuanensis TaxID=1073196 RepID=A0A286D5N4_9GAMM|nr:hypothetical protein [Pseudoxanthomonas wuyuanensis]SOD53947.1 hypothetical protein SAMN06296416_10316 [Pseudoxanthomonas wuyuanensis]